VVALLDTVAFPLLAHTEAKFTVIGVVTGTPLTETAILVVPKAESGLTPNTMLESVTEAAPTEKPDDAVTGVVPTWAVALRVVAPEVKPAVNVIVTLPLVSVNAVPLEGVRVARVGSVRLKVTTALGTPVAMALSRVAVTVTGVPVESVLAKGVMVRVGVPAVPPTDSVARFVA
jgi:hypothetical protein